ncbi:MAG: hypothetical protein D6785_05050, partial [Planctomycetota bacterium]
LQGSEVDIRVGNKSLKTGDTWYTPMNSPSATVALFSEQRDGWRIFNGGKKSITIDSIQIQVGKGVQKEEFQLQEYSYKKRPLKFKKKTLPPRRYYDFYVRFYPVCSGERRASLKIIIDGKEYSFHIVGHGQTKVKFFSHGKTILSKVLGSSKADEMVSAMVVDRAGNIFFSGHVSGVLDKYGYDIILGRINQDGSLGWLKVWYGKFRDFSKDPGQNNETGGGANCMAMDDQGYIYFVGSTSPNRYNNNYAALILKVDPKDGSLIWEKLWRPEWPRRILAKHHADGYGVDVKNGKVFVTGTTPAAVGKSSVYLLVLSGDTGRILFQKAYDLSPTLKDRGYVVKVDSSANVYIGGSANNNAFLMRLSPSGQDYKLAWAKRIVIGRGGNINSMDLDSSGNIYVALDRRGATTFFSFAKISPKGELVWGKTYQGGNNDQNNINIVKVIGKFLYAGGRIGLKNFDTQYGDGLIVKTDLQEGNEIWSAFYFTGKGPDEIGEHRIKGIALRGKDLILLGQVYTGNYNGVRYWGYWYDGTSSLTDFQPNVEDIEVKKEQILSLNNGDLKDAKSHRKYVDGKKYFPYLDSKRKRNGKSPDGDFMFWKIQLK